MPVRPVIIAATLALCACGPAGPTSAPAQYPKLPATPKGLVFEPSEALLPFTLTCRDAELPGENGLDDDCDGHIDRPRKPTPALTLATATVSPTAFHLRLLPEAGACPLQAQTQEHLQGEALLVTRVDLLAPSCGRYRVELAADPESPPDASAPALTFSVETPAGIRTYALRPGSTERTLGHIEPR